MLNVLIYSFCLILKACETDSDCTEDNFPECIGPRYINGTIVNGKCRKNFILSNHKMFVF